ncbi:MAG TPA: hypothetical protein VL860_04660, partial [Planctomycetota bacterium]|nr:hypothetical protein [Planctomycetota bacterium]
ADLDLTGAVIAGLNEAYVRRRTAGPHDPNDLFDLGKSETQIVAEYTADLRAVKSEQAEEDRQRFEAWHKYQRQVLQRLLPPATTP